MQTAKEERQQGKKGDGGGWGGGSQGRDETARKELCERERAPGQQA